VILAIELEDQSGVGIEQVGYAEEVLVEVEHGLVDQQAGQADASMANIRSPGSTGTE
jgi:hypothetical protein